MAIMTSSASKSCATCAFWGGVREVRAMGRQVAYKTRAGDKGEGVCGNRSALKHGRPVPANFTGCSKYTKWSVLK